MVWKSIKKMASGAATTITLLNFFFKIEKIQDLAGDSFLSPFLSYKYRNIVVIGLLILFFILYIVSSCMSIKKQGEANEKIHFFFHSLRDHTFQLKKDRCESYSAYKNQVKNTSEILCDYIYDYLLERYNKKFSVCIKFIDITSSRTSTSTNEMRVLTLCRGGHTKIQREQMEKNSGEDSVLLKNDTSYMRIMSNDSKNGRKSEFVCCNLPAYCFIRALLGQPYLPKFKSFYKKYLSTIVVPIRISSEKLPQESKYINPNDTSFQVFGFLCIDYKWIMKKRQANSICIELKAFADSLYTIYDEVIKRDISEKKLKPVSCQQV